MQTHTSETPTANADASLHHTVGTSLRCPPALAHRSNGAVPVLSQQCNAGQLGGAHGQQTQACLSYAPRGDAAESGAAATGGAASATIQRSSTS